MAKTFGRRESKKERAVVNLPIQDRLKEILKSSDEKLLRGAKLQDLKLADITVREQVRTKFNDDSLRDLGENIKANGLIQPLVVHREAGKFVLICGERRFRAMNLIKFEVAPCFVLENKSVEELMAIQFSENSSRENLHYIDKADGIYNYKLATDASERKICQDLGISKTEVHRSLIVAQLPKEIKEAAKMYDVEKYVLLEWDELENGIQKDTIKEKLLCGQLTKRSQLKLQAGKSKSKTSNNNQTKQLNISARELAKLLKNGSTSGLDSVSKEMLKRLLNENEGLENGDSLH